MAETRRNTCISEQVKQKQSFSDPLPPMHVVFKCTAFSLSFLDALVPVCQYGA